MESWVPVLRRTIKVPLRCQRLATPAEVVSAVEKTRQMYRCSLLEEETCFIIFQLMELTMVRLREICEEWSRMGTKFNLNPLRDSIHELISALQRRRYVIAEEVDQCLNKWKDALGNMQRVRENTIQARPVHTPGMKTYSVGYRVHPHS